MEVIILWQANLQICRNIAHYYLYPTAHRLQTLGVRIRQPELLADG